MLDAVPSSEISTLSPDLSQSSRNALCTLSHTVLPSVAKRGTHDFKPAPCPLPIISPLERHKMIAATQIYRKGCETFQRQSVRAGIGKCAKRVGDRYR